MLLLLLPLVLKDAAQDICASFPLSSLTVGTVLPTLYPIPGQLFSPRPTSTSLHLSHSGPLSSAALSLCLGKARKMRAGGNVWEQRCWAHRACTMVPALLLESPSYPLHLMKPVQDSLIHLQEDRRNKWFEQAVSSKTLAFEHVLPICWHYLRRSRRCGHTRGGMSLRQALRFQKPHTIPRAVSLLPACCSRCKILAS